LRNTFVKPANQFFHTKPFELNIHHFPQAAASIQYCCVNIQQPSGNPNQPINIQVGIEFT